MTKIPCFWTAQTLMFGSGRCLVFLVLPEVIMCERSARRPR